MSDGAVDRLSGWRRAAIADVAGGERHTIHSYFNVSPESPDASRVLFFSSADRDGHLGELVVRDRQTGAERTVATDVVTEDAHRQACQQWLSHGRRIVFHDLRNERWCVVAVDAETCEQQVVAHDRLVSWGAAGADLVPLYGPHWAPGAHRHLELLDVAAGTSRVVLTVDALVDTYGEWMDHALGGRDGVSIFFPILSPDGGRVVFKLSRPRDGQFRSAAASTREGLFCYDLAQERITVFQERWGHPAWHPDGRTLLNTGARCTDTVTGVVTTHPGQPPFPGSHPAFAADGLFATDTRMASFGGAAGQWGVAVGDFDDQQHVFVDQFDFTGGASSWRPPHPHPCFSHDAQRLYFNAVSGSWTRLRVATRGGAA